MQKNSTDLFKLCTKYLENTNWAETIAQYRPFQRFLWYFGAKIYYNLQALYEFFQILITF